jgi:hypothetical protein
MEHGEARVFALIMGAGIPDNLLIRQATSPPLW